MRTASLRLIICWIVGSMIGTLIVGFTSPAFVRSYLPLQVDPVRGVWTMPAGQVFRWRGEGYADTQIGPLGMPGKRSIPAASAETIRIALWGDSQAEGVCLADDLKLHRQVQRAARQSGRSATVFPLARSGEDAGVWLTQMPVVQAELSIDFHALLIVDLPDLIAATEAPLPPPGADDVRRAQGSLAARLPAFVIQAARHLLTEADGRARRKLRFSVGPVLTQSQPQLSGGGRPDPDWQGAVAAIRQTTSLPVVILYAPILPQIVGGGVRTDDPHDQQFRDLQAVAQQADLIVVDLRQPLLRESQNGNWPHGFHNGLIGSGHLNRHGYNVVAHALVDVIMRETQQAE